MSNKTTENSVDHIEIFWSLRVKQEKKWQVTRILMIEKYHYSPAGIAGSISNHQIKTWRCQNWFAKSMLMKCQYLLCYVKKMDFKLFFLDCPCFCLTLLFIFTCTSIILWKYGLWLTQNWNGIACKTKMCSALMTYIPIERGGRDKVNLFEPL